MLYIPTHILYFALCGESAVGVSDDKTEDVTRQSDYVEIDKAPLLGLWVSGAEWGLGFRG